MIHETESILWYLQSAQRAAHASDVRLVISALPPHRFFTPTQPSPSALINHTVSRSPVYNIGRAPFLLAQAIGVKQVHCTQPKVVLWARPGHVLANLQGLWEGRHSRDISLRCIHDHAYQLLERTVLGSHAGTPQPPGSTAAHCA